MRYLVIVQQDVALGEVDPDVSDEEAGEVYRQEVAKVIPCETTREVAKVVRENSDWSVWEVTPRGVEQRAIVSKMDGRFLYDVEVT